MVSCGEADEEKSMFGKMSPSVIFSVILSSTLESVFIQVKLCLVHFF